MSEADILFEIRGALGLITLNRPQALNALTHAMVLALESQLDAWQRDDRIRVVAVMGAGQRAFCAGGDIRALYDAGRPGGARGASNFQFYADEYRVNTLIKRYPKPYVALMDGIVMGGGVGVSIHGSHRVATEHTVFAMPETGIGLFPDVGGTWFLPRLPGEIGMWLGLTGARLKGREAVTAGICDAFARADALDAFIAELAEATSAGDVDALIAGLGTREDATLAHRQEIDQSFGAPGIEALLAALAEAETDWAARQREIILTKSPTLTKLAFRQIRTGAGLCFEDCMRLEYRLARFSMTHGDFYEGVRAAIIDKDGAPNWSPARLMDVSEDMIARAFAELGPEELRL